jgi:pilus assembly protein Flp/PilA
MIKVFKKFASEEDGVTAIEYGLIAALIAVAIIAGVTLVGSNLGNTFNTVGSAVSN